MYRTNNELRNMYHLVQKQNRVLSEQLQAARDVNEDLSKDLAALKVQLEAFSVLAAAGGMKPCFPDGIVIVLR